MIEIVKLPSNGLTVEVLEPLAQECWAMFDQGRSYRYDLNLPHLVSTWNRLSVLGSTVTWLAVRKGENIGVLGALFLPDLFSGRSTAFEQFWFVKRVYRRHSNAAGLLWRAFEREAIDRGCEQIAAGTNVGPSPRGMARMYQKMGFTLLGQEFRKSI